MKRIGQLAILSALNSIAIEATNAATEWGDAGGLSSASRVVIRGVYNPGYGFLATSSMPVYSAMGHFPHYKTDMAMDRWLAYLEEMQVARANPITTNDIRCNVYASDPTRKTTSRADLTDRYLAAHQIFSVISAQEAGRGAKAAISGSPTISTTVAHARRSQSRMPMAGPSDGS